jgi:putative ABC transport system permease protein
MMAMPQDLRHGMRALRRQPSFAITAIITFTLAIGTTTAIFAALYAIVLTPLPLREPSRLVVLWRSDAALNQTVAEVSHRHFRDWRERTRSFESLSAIGSVNWSLLWSMSNGERQRIPTAGVSASMFSTLGASAALGRTFVPEEDQRGARRTVIISDSFWAHQFGRDPAIVGRALTLDDKPFAIVGVMPRGFAYPYKAEMWTPIIPLLEDSERRQPYPIIDNPSYGLLYVVGRLKPGVTVTQAKQDLDAVMRAVHQDDRKAGAASPETDTGVVTPLVEHLFGRTQDTLVALGGTGLIVLLIACANIIGLLLVRAIAGRRDAAIRLALGASRAQMLRLWLSESLLLAAAGLAGGVLLAQWGAKALVALAPASTPNLDRVEINLPVIVFACVVCLASAMVCGLVPAWIASRPVMRDALTDGARGSEGRSPRRARHALVIVQLGMAMMLLVAAGLMVRSVVNLYRLDLGYEPSRLLTVSVETSRKGRPQVQAFVDEVMTRVRALPEVESVAGMNLVPLALGPIGNDALVILEGQDVKSMEWLKNPAVSKQTVTPGYFEAMGTRLIAGRTFTRQDNEHAPMVCVLSETAARKLWPGQPSPSSALGRKVLIPGSVLDVQGRMQFQTVIGIVEDARFRGVDDVRLDGYLAYAQTTDNVGWLMIRTKGGRDRPSGWSRRVDVPEQTVAEVDPANVAASVRSVVKGIDSQAIISRVEPLEEIVATATAPWRFAMMLFAVLATVAFALAITGLSGFISYAVAQRHREIAIRLALGALPYQVRMMIVRQGATLVAVGLVLGVTGALLVSRLLSTLLFGVEPFDLLTFAGVAGLVTAIALLACHLSARNTTRIQAWMLLR